MTDHNNSPFRLRLWMTLAALAVMCVSVHVAHAQKTATIYTDGTNFGIGTTGPTQKLQVVGTIVATTFSGDGSGLTGISAGGWTDGGTNVYTSVTTDNVGIGTTTPSTTLEIVKQGTQSPLMVSASATGDGNYLIVTSSGNVGIGDTNPGDPLAIVRADSTTSLAITNTNSTAARYPGLYITNYMGAPNAGNPLIDSYNYRGDSGAPAAVQNGDVLFAFQGYGANGVAYGNNLAAKIYFEASETFSGSAGGGRIIFATAENGTTTPQARMYVHHNGNVGIGTVGPTQKLQVVGTVLATAFVGDGSGLTGISAGGWTDGGANVFTSTTTDLVAIGTTTPASLLTVNGNVGIGTTLPYRMIAAPANGMVVEGNVGIGTFAAASGKLIVMGGNVGVGTLAPSFAIEVRGAGNAGGDLGAQYISTSSSGWANNRFVNNAGSDGWVGVGGSGTNAAYAGRAYLASSGGVSLVGDGSNSDIRYYQSISGVFTEWARFNTSGNFGIGTTTPVAGLAVMNGNVGIGTWSPANRMSVVGNIGIGTTLPYRRIAAPNNGMVVEGNVGIGTWNPSATMQVNGQGSSSVALLVNTGDLLVGTNKPVQIKGSNTGSATYTGLYIENGTTAVDNTTVLSFGSGSYGAIANIYGVVTSPSYGGLGFETTNVSGTNERMRLNQDGNLGIGTTAPQGALTVMNGNVGIGTWSPTQRLQVVGTVSATSFVGDGSGLTGISAGGWTDGGTNVYTSTTTDIVGIGTTTPTASLEVAMSGPGVAFETSSADFSSFGINHSSSGISFYISGGSGATPGDLGLGFSSTFEGTPSPDHIFKESGNVGIGTTNPRGALTVMNGNVGIGTWSPTAKLQVTGNALVSTRLDVGASAGTVGNPGAINILSVGSTTTLTFKNDVLGESQINFNTSQGLEIATLAASPVTIVPNNVTSAYFGSGGNVGIGTSGPVGGTAIMNGNVGIGTWNPVNRLSIVGNIGIGTTLPYRRISAPNDGMVVEGNVGIGTWNPSKKLQVFGDALVKSSVNSTTAFEVQTATGTPILSIDTTTSYTSLGGGLSAANQIDGINGDAGTPSFSFLNDTDTGIFGSGGNNLLGFTTGGVERMRIISGGNVGIGTSAPVGGLIVMNGNVGIGTWSPTQRLQVVGTVSATAFVGDGSGLTGLPAGGGWTDGGTNVYASTTTDLVAIGTTTPVSTLTVKGNVGIGTTTPYITIAAPANGMVVEGNVGIGTFAALNGKVIVMGGNVGIGTTFPAGIFDVRGGTAAASTNGTNINIVAQNAGSGNQNGGHVFLTAGTPTGTGTRGRVVLGDPQYNIATGANPTVIVADDTNEPVVQFEDLNSDTTYMGMTSGSHGFFAIATENSLQGIQFKVNGSFGNDYLNNAATTTAMTILSSGSIGIGTLSPINTLSLVGNIGIGTTLPYRRIAAPNNGMVVEGNVGIGTWTVNGGKLIVLGGPVGMGTTAPGEELVIYRSQASGTVVSVLNPSGSAGGYAEFNAGSDAGNVRFGIEENSAGGAAYVWNTASSALQFGTSNAERMRVSNSGNVGIGTTTPVAGLTVMNGNVGIGTWSPVNRLQVKGSFTAGVVTLTDAATIATNASLGNLFRVTLGGNRTLGNPTNGVDGQKVTWELIQDGAGSRTITLDTKFALGSDISSVTLSTTASKRDFLGAIYNSTEDKWYVVSFVKGY